MYIENKPMAIRNLQRQAALRQQPREPQLFDWQKAVVRWFDKVKARFTKAS